MKKPRPTGLKPAKKYHGVKIRVDRHRAQVGGWNVSWRGELICWTPALSDARKFADGHGRFITNAVREIYDEAKTYIRRNHQDRR